MFIDQQAYDVLNPMFIWAAFDAFADFSLGMTYGAFTEHRETRRDFGRTWCAI